MKTKPTIEDRKIPRSVSIRQSVDRIAKEHGMDLGSIIEDAILMSCGSDPEEIELKKLEKEISRLQSELAPKVSRLAYLKESVARKRRLQTDLTIERECHPWYLRSLVQSGIFRVMRKESIDPGTVIDQLLKDGNILESDVELTKDGWHISKSASRKAMRYLSSFIEGEGHLIPTEGLAWVIPGKEDLLAKYSISLDFEELSNEIIVHPTGIGDEPVEFYIQFSPRIVSDRVKSEIKKKMELYYATASVEVQNENTAQ